MAVDVDDEDFDYLEESLKQQEEILREQRDRARQMVGREQMDGALPPLPSGLRSRRLAT